MNARKLELKLIPVSKKLTAKGGYRGHIVDRGELGYDAVIQEMLDKKYLRFTPDTVKMVVEALFNTMIEGILQDGRTRRLGDYLMLQLEVRGGFEEPGEQFDPKKHKLAMVLRPLKEFRQTAGKKDVSVFNRNAGPKVVIEKMHSASHPLARRAGDGEVPVAPRQGVFRYVARETSRIPRRFHAPQMG